MKGLMKKFVLVTLLLQLCLSVQTVNGFTTPTGVREPKFGDIIRFDRKLPCTDLTVYSHYGVYIGRTTEIEGKGPDEDIFEMTKVDGETGCRFGKLDGTFTVSNDKDDTLRPKTEEEIKKAVLNMKESCRPWRIHNTCEHVATSIRYGDINRQCNQQNTLMEPVCKLYNKLPNILKIIGKFRGRRSKYLRAAAAAA